MIADVGLVGFPNVGKSTLLSRVSNADPKIANYHFTTLSPNLGVVDLEGCRGFVIADIPGLIEGASEGAGLGFEFLRHIERTRMLIHLVDAASVEGRDPVEDVYKINRELKKYNAGDRGPAPGDRCQQDRRSAGRRGGERGAAPEGGIRAPGDPGVRHLRSQRSGESGSCSIMCSSELDKLPRERIVFEPEFSMEDLLAGENLPYTVTVSAEDPHTFIVEGPKVEKMLGYTNLDSEKGFAFFPEVSGYLRDSSGSGEGRHPGGRHREDVRPGFRLL